MLSVLGGCDSGQTTQDSVSIPPSEKSISTAVPQGRAAGETRLSVAASKDSEGPAIVAFGDSLTAGLGVAKDQSYPSQLQERLRKAGYTFRVVNAGVNGDTTAGGLRRVEWVLKSAPKIVILELGANDGLRGHRLEETFSNLEQIIHRFQDEGVTVILAGMKIPPNYGREYTSRFSEMYKNLSRKYRVPLIPFFLEGVAANPELNQADGIHPTAKGYNLVVENVMNVLGPILEKRKDSG